MFMNVTSINADDTIFITLHSYNSSAVYSLRFKILYSIVNTNPKCPFSNKKSVDKGALIVGIGKYLCTQK